MPSSVALSDQSRREASLSRAASEGVHGFWFVKYRPRIEVETGSFCPVGSIHRKTQ